MVLQWLRGSPWHSEDGMMKGCRNETTQRGGGETHLDTMSKRSDTQELDLRREDARARKTRENVYKPGTRARARAHTHTL